MTPFTFVGAQKSDSMVDSAPLRDLAQLNLAHYRNLGDYENSAFFVGYVVAYRNAGKTIWKRGFCSLVRGILYSFQKKGPLALLRCDPTA